MKEFFKRIRASVILSALISLALGIVLVIWPVETMNIVCKVIAAGLIVLGVVEIIVYIRDRSVHLLSGALGLVSLLVGIWLFLRPDLVMMLVPIVIGVLLVFHGIQDFKLAVETKRNNYAKWWIILLLAFVGIVLGALCIIDAFGIVTLELVVIGIALIYDGISDLWIVSRTLYAARKVRKEEQALESDYREVVDDDVPQPEEAVESGEPEQEGSVESKPESEGSDEPDKEENDVSD